MKKGIEKKDDSKNKQEKLTPQQVWKNASMILGTKKKEPAPKVQETVYRPVDFEHISKKLSEITKERIDLISGEDKKDKFIDAELKNSLYHIPDYSDLETVYKPKKYVEIPDFFPKHPINIFESPDVYKKLDIDTLFFIFYSQSNTVQQYYAATQLKLYSWRFHTKYLTWFQRLDEPKLITTDYERGDFLFFDYDVTWSFMKKSDFTFEYKYLECAEL